MLSEGTHEFLTFTHVKNAKTIRIIALGLNTSVKINNEFYGPLPNLVFENLTIQCI